MMLKLTDSGQTTLDEFMMSHFGAEPRVPSRNKPNKSRSCNSTPDGRVAKTGHPNEKRKIGSIRDFFIPLNYWLPKCTVLINQQICGAPAIRKRGRNASGKQRYECARGHRFVTYSIFDKFDPTGLEIFLDTLCTCGRLSEALRVASKIGLVAGLGQARRIVRYVVKLVQNFENNCESLKIPIVELTADEMYQRVWGKGRTRLHSHAWIIVLYESYFHYILEARVCKGRTFIEAKKAFDAMSSRCRNLSQKILRTDALPIYERLAEKYKMILATRKKAEDFGFINKIERLFSYLRMTGLRKTTSFPYGMLTDLVGILRLHNNYFKRYEVLNYRTPVEAATGFRFRSWQHLIATAEVIAPLPKKYVKGKILDLFSN